MHQSFARRRALVLWLRPRAWRQRLTFWLGAIAVGLVAVGFALAADAAQAGFRAVVARAPWAPLVALPAGLAFCAWAAARYFPGSQGSGIPQAIAARIERTPAARRKLLALPIAAGKVGLTLLGLLVGASIGREGPTVQIGAAILLAAGRVLGLATQRGFVRAGGAAGVAAAFNTPLAGIVFAIEEMSRSYEQRASGLVLVAVFLAGITSLALLGDYTYFGHSTAALGNPWDWAAVPVCGALGGLAGGAFSRAVVLAGDRANRVGALLARRPVVTAAACGLAIALIGLAAGGRTWGTGYPEARGLVEGTALLPWYFAPAKLLATLLSTVSGIPGGIFAPSLAVGAGLGADLAPLLPAGAAGAVVLLGMVGYFTGVVQAPITGAVIVMEMAGDHAMVIPMMATALIASGVSRLVQPHSLYHALAERFLTAR
jgi:H+/Cl- antiporter ClcA